MDQIFRALTSPTVPVMEATATIPLSMVQASATLPPAKPMTPTPPTPPLNPVPGIEVYQVDPTSADLVIQAGGYWARRNALLWSDVEPELGARNWEAMAGLEKEMQLAAQQGLQLILIVRSTPDWAQAKSGSFCGPITDGKLASFAQFMQEVVQRYSAPPYDVKYWELWNEPDIDSALVTPDSPYGCWGDATDEFYGGRYYAEMLKQVYPQVKAADPEAQVLIGGLLLDCDPVNPPEGKDCLASKFLEGILQGGGGDYFDGISFHAYDYYPGPQSYNNSNWNSSWDSTGPVVIAKSRYLHSLLAAFQKPGKFLMNTEAGLLCGRTGDEELCQGSEYEFTKAKYAAQVNVAALAERLRANIWYSLHGWRGTELVDNQNKPNAAYEAFRFNASQLAGAAVVGAVTEIPGVSGYELRRGAQRLQILWSLDGEVHVYPFDQPPRSVYDLFGESIPPSKEITIGALPVYVEW